MILCIFERIIPLIIRENRKTAFLYQKVLEIALEDVGK